MLVIDVLIGAPAASAEIRALWRDAIRRTLLNVNQLCFGELLLFPDDFGRNQLALNGVRNKHGFAVFPSDPFATERDVFDFQINKSHLINTLGQPGVSARFRNELGETSQLHWANRPLDSSLEVAEFDGFDEMLGEAGL
jgi:hypothetical protein